MERGSSHQGRGTPEEWAQERTRDVSPSQGGSYLDIEETAWSPSRPLPVDFGLRISDSGFFKFEIRYEIRYSKLGSGPTPCLGSRLFGSCPCRCPRLTPSARVRAGAGARPLRPSASIRAGSERGQACRCRLSVLPRPLTPVPQLLKYCPVPIFGVRHSTFMIRYSTFRPPKTPLPFISDSDSAIR